jgi:inositol oxygenase
MLVEPQNLSDTLKTDVDFRNYVNSDRQSKVENTYRGMCTNQTLEYVLQQKKTTLERIKNKTFPMTFWEALEKLDQLIDDSDPDTSSQQTIHAFQTAEAIRRDHPDKDWFQLVGFIHDFGKVLCLLDQPLPQWSVVGDTFPVGCKHETGIVFYKYFELNPDTKDERLNTKFGIYEPNCGLDKVHFSWGHDEYMYTICKENNCVIPEEGLWCIRYHSFYPWHKEKQYKHLLDDRDVEKMKWVLEFNKYDLYSKKSEIPCDVDALKEYYSGLFVKYFPDSKIYW